MFSPERMRSESPGLELSPIEQLADLGKDDPRLEFEDRKTGTPPEGCSFLFNWRFQKNCVCSISMLIWVWKKLENAARKDERRLGSSARLRRAQSSFIQRKRMQRSQGEEQRRKWQRREGGIRPAHRLRYLDGLAIREGPFLRLLMLFYGNLLGLLITENRPTFKNKSNVSIGWTHTQWLSKTKNDIFCNNNNNNKAKLTPFLQCKGLTVTKNLPYSPSLAIKLYISAASWS